MSGFIVKVRFSTTWKTAYYTGRAGTGRLDADRAQAFIYATEPEAYRKSRLFAKQNPQHVWMTDFADPVDAHNAGAAAMSRDACG